MRTKHDEKVVEPILETRKIGQLEESEKLAIKAYYSSPDPKNRHKDLEKWLNLLQMGSATH